MDLPHMKLPEATPQNRMARSTQAETAELLSNASADLGQDSSAEKWLGFPCGSMTFPCFSGSDINVFNILPESSRMFMVKVSFIKGCTQITSGWEPTTLTFLSY